MSPTPEVNLNAVLIALGILVLILLNISKIINAFKGNGRNNNERDLILLRHKENLEKLDRILDEVEDNKEILQDRTVIFNNVLHELKEIKSEIQRGVLLAEAGLRDNKISFNEFQAKWERRFEDSMKAGVPFWQSPSQRVDK